MSIIGEAAQCADYMLLLSRGTLDIKALYPDAFAVDYEALEQRPPEDAISASRWRIN